VNPLFRCTLFSFLFLVTLNGVYASPTDPVSKQTITDNSAFRIDKWDNLSFKHQKAENAWINDYHRQNWDSTLIMGGVV